MHEPLSTEYGRRRTSNEVVGFGVAQALWLLSTSIAVCLVVSTRSSRYKRLYAGSPRVGV